MERESLLEQLIQKCRKCGICAEECSFLRQHGLPGALAERALSGEAEWLVLAYGCSLCGLCRVSCPLDLDVPSAFLAIREEAVKRGLAPLPTHRRLLAFERMGVNPLLTLNAIPPGCKMVFFPGCSLPGIRPEVVKELLLHLRMKEESIGVILNCCTKPSHDLGQKERFAARFHGLCQRLRERGVQRVVVACPNCYRVFRYNAEGLETVMVYELLDVARLERIPMRMVLHDPCSVRFEPKVQEGVRSLLRRLEAQVEDMVHSREKTLCCGEGGGVSLAHPHFAERWRSMVEADAAGAKVVTYCAGCVSRLSQRFRCIHVLDVILKGPEQFTSRARLPRPPLTYINRWLLKRYFKKILNG